MWRMVKALKRREWHHQYDWHYIMTYNKVKVPIVNPRCRGSRYLRARAFRTITLNSDAWNPRATTAEPVIMLGTLGIQYVDKVLRTIM